MGLQSRGSEVRFVKRKRKQTAKITKSNKGNIRPWSRTPEKRSRLQKETKHEDTNHTQAVQKRNRNTPTLVLLKQVAVFSTPLNYVYQRP